MSNVNIATFVKNQKVKCTHGHRQWKNGNPHPVYKKWAGMLRRCSNPNEVSYPAYGGKGIKVSQDWHNYLNFWSDMGESLRDGLTIERIENSKGYSVDNCRWATVFEQSRNRSSNKVITFDGKTMTFRDWESLLGLKRGIVSSRYIQGFSPKDCLSLHGLRWRHLTARRSPSSHPSV